MAAMLDCAPQDLRFSGEGKAGKPLLDPEFAARQPELEFNMSHTRGFVAAAFASSPIGVDVERVCPIPEMRDLIADLMHPVALSAFDAETDAGRQTALFFRYWTLSEAFLKATGEGLTETTRDLAFNATGTPRLRAAAGGDAPEIWHFGHVSDGCEDWLRAPTPNAAIGQ